MKEKRYVVRLGTTRGEGDYVRVWQTTLGTLVYRDDGGPVEFDRETAEKVAKERVGRVVVATGRVRRER